MLVTLFGGGAYVLGSHWMMRRHTAPRPLRVAAVEAAREAWRVMVTQPLLPLFYFLGGRMGEGRRGGRPVVFVHGYGQNRGCFRWLAGRMNEQGSGPLFGFNYPWFLSLDECARRLGREIQRIRRRTGSEEVDLVCHSMGGLVALEYLRQSGVASWVRRCVTIASPHGGVPWGGPIPGQCGQQIRCGSEYLKRVGHLPVSTPTLSIFSTHDNVVHPPTTSSLARRGGHDLCLPAGGHLSVLFSEDVARHVISFLGQSEADLQDSWRTPLPEMAG
jgi:predicted alpha/beta hydrolase family esterase